MMEKIQDIAALEAWGVEIYTGRLESERSFKRACEGTLCFTHSGRGAVRGPLVPLMLECGDQTRKGTIEEEKIVERSSFY